MDRRNLKVHRLIIVDHHNIVLEMSDLTLEQTKRRGQNHYIESHPTTYSDKHTKCQDLNRIIDLTVHTLDSSSSNIVEVAKGQKDLIPKHHHCHNLVDDTKNQTLNEQVSVNLI